MIWITCNIFVNLDFILFYKETLMFSSFEEEVENLVGDFSCIWYEYLWINYSMIFWLLLFMYRNTFDFYILCPENLTNVKNMKFSL